MPRAARAHAHERIAGWIESLPPDRAEDRVEMLAHHLVQAVEYGRAAGLDVVDISSRAALALRDAGDRAWKLGQPVSAFQLFEQARELDPSLAEDPYFQLRIGRTRHAWDLQGGHELESAASVLAESDPAAAAEALMALGESRWQHGDHAGAVTYYDRAATMVESLPPSRGKLAVIGQRARFATLAGRSAEGLAAADEAIALARELDEEDLLSDALTTRGTVRSNLGDAGGVEDIESSLELSLQRGSWRAGRAYLNLGSTLMSHFAEIERSHAYTTEGLQFIESRGFRQIRWFRANLAESAFHLGLWDDAQRLAESELADPEPHYLRPLCRIVVGHLLLARDATPEALAEAARGADEARAIVDPQALAPGLATLAFIAARARDTALASSAVGELRDRLEELGSAGGQAGSWVVELGLALLELGRESEILDGSFELGIATPWRQAAAEIGRGRLVEAATLLAATGSVTFESYVRHVAAQRLSAEGRHAEAARQLEPALEFYRRVGATAAIRDAETLLAAAS
jgi:tetratricopeptide (TPR) repeat protein